jgi:Pyruvate/2-oxoacid:ferredoxin oxidoreductase gamma subunit
VTVADLDERANTARLAAITADPNKTAAFVQLGYIADSSGLQDFYMDSKIGKEQLESNRNTGAFVAEAIRRNSTGIATGATQLADFKKIAAELTAKGYTEAQISTAAATGFQNIGQDLRATTALAGIYEKAGGTVTTNAALQETIQSELTQEEFMNMPSSRRKTLEEQNKKAFQGTAGLTASSLTSKMV